MIQNETQLDENLFPAKPAAGVVETLARLDGDMILLGWPGKWARRWPAWPEEPPMLAGVRRRVIGVSRFF